MRLPKLTIRRLLHITALVAIATAIAQTFFTRPPRPYHTAEELFQRYSHGGWDLEVSPDITGPYRTSGDDWSSAMPFQFNIGQPVTAKVSSGIVTRNISYPGREGVSYTILLLENFDDQPTYMILSRVEDQTF